MTTTPEAVFVIAMVLGHLASYLNQRARGQVRPNYRAYLRDFPHYTLSAVGAMAAAYVAASQYGELTKLPLPTLIASGIGTGFGLDVVFNRGKGPDDQPPTGAAPLTQ